ncbi:hypothetical protein Y1Q_0010293 [Alligator mississippiensis]|uniref:Uncharacterized protein n=1 Tax=Alligator mississippiensis TaxID=8496 RepID=A0A151NMY7_ALLMI|nr:hypothetical protein Y1Q_0010293 [Alligator mississippiensis]
MGPLEDKIPLLTCDFQTSSPFPHFVLSPPSFPCDTTEQLRTRDFASVAQDSSPRISMLDGLFCWKACEFCLKWQSKERNSKKKIISL